MVAKRRESQLDDKYAPPASHRTFKPREPWAGPTEYGRATLAKIKADLAAFTHQKPNKEWAKRVLDRHRGGEHVPQHFLDMALQVAGDATAPYQTQREPGSDDE